MRARSCGLRDSKQRRPSCVGRTAPPFTILDPPPLLISVFHLLFIFLSFSSSPSSFSSHIAIPFRVAHSSLPRTSPIRPNRSLSLRTHLPSGFTSYSIPSLTHTLLTVINSYPANISSGTSIRARSASRMFNERTLAKCARNAALPAASTRATVKERERKRETGG